MQPSQPRRLREPSRPYLPTIDQLEGWLGDRVENRTPGQQRGFPTMEYRQSDGTGILISTFGS